MNLIFLYVLCELLADLCVCYVQAVEWYTQAHEVLIKTGLKKQDLVNMVKDSTAQFRLATRVIGVHYTTLGNIARECSLSTVQC